MPLRPCSTLIFATLLGGLVGFTSAAQTPRYDFTAPDATFELPKELREISGITVLDDTFLAAVQDEDGKVYFINYHTGDIEKDEKFGKDADFEDIVRVDQALYVLESDGDVHEIKDWTEKDYDAKRHETRLSSRYDTEGLAYDAANARLLIACKEYPGKGLKGHKAIYAFDLDTEEVSKDPVFLISTRAIEEWGTRSDGKKSDTNKLQAFLSRTITGSPFKPAALAQHPRTGNWYVVSSVQKTIAVLDSTGILTDLLPLPDTLFPQPEGMAFLPNGDLLLSNEGRSGRATLLRFNDRSP